MRDTNVKKYINAEARLNASDGLIRSVVVPLLIGVAAAVPDLQACAYRE